jgi:hypothetical protein
MFRSAPDVEPAPARIDPDGLIPLSHFELDHPSPVEGWPTFLGRRGIAFLPDDLGRDCIRRSDARRLLDEKRANEIQAARLREVAEQEAVEADQLRRAQIWRGIPADHLPDGVPPAAAMLQASRDAQPRRTTPLEEALSNSSEMTYHALPRGDEE